MGPVRVKPPKGETRPSSKSTWQFIDISELHGSKNDELRKLVRANAMRDYHRKQKATQNKQKPLDAGYSAPTVALSTTGDIVLPRTQCDGGLQALDEVFQWTTEWESTVFKLESATTCPYSSRALLAAVSSGLQIDADGRVSLPRTKLLEDSISALVANPGNGVGDPFHTLPTSALDAYELIHHCMFPHCHADSLKSRH